MAGTLTPTPYQTVLDADGVAVSGALIYTYVGGTTTAATTYADASLATPNTNPIVADSAGRFVAYLPAGGNFKFAYKTAAGATIEEQDNILSVPGAAVNLDIEGTVGEAVTAGQVCYLSTGAEAIPLTAGLWYLTDADFAPTSTTCQSVGVAVSAIAINTAGTIRLAGTATTASAVVIGSTYYVSATAGAITATAPALSRTVGVALTTSTLLLAATTAVVTPAGSNTQVQFNDAGVLGGDAGFTYIKATDAVAIAGATTVGGTLGVTGVTTLTGGLNTPLVPAQGGTGLSSYAVGDLVYASGSTTLAKLADVAVGQVLVSGGVATAPAYSASPSITALTYTTNLKSTTALATPAALTATQATAFASTVSGAAIMGFGTTNDVALMNRAGTVVLGIGPNTTDVNMTGLLSVTGFGVHSFSAGGTGGQALQITNTTSGATMQAYLGLTAGTAVGFLQAFSQGFTTSGPFVASGVALRSDGAGGISVYSSHASGTIRFYSGGTTLRGAFATGGNFLIGNISAAINNGLQSVSYNGLAHNAIVLDETGNTNGTSYVQFSQSGTLIGNIARVASTSAVVYNTTSDQRLKTDRGLATDIARLRDLPIHNFDWKSDGTTDRGVFAQEAHSLYPLAVTKGSDELNDRGQLAKPWSVSYASFVPDLIVGWQQHDATISQLAARIAALESQDN